MTPVRSAAARLLLAIDERQVTLAGGLDQAREGLDDPRDRALIGEIVTGTLRWRAALDAIIETASRRRAETLDPPVRAVLRLGVYQLKHLTRVPAHAVVHDSVEVIKALSSARASGFVNAVLRSIQRGAGRNALPKRPGPDATSEHRVSFLSTTLSHPAWLVRRWLDRYGFERTERWCEYNNAVPEITIRSVGRISIDALRAQLAEASIDSQPGRHVHDALRLDPGSLGRTPAEIRQDMFVQHEAAQMVARVARAQPGERVLDVCAAPGGKTLVLASDMRIREGNSSLLVAGDRRPSRVRLLARTFTAAGLRLPVVALDALGPLPFGPVFDCVLLDAPCSGLGTLSRDPDLKWTREEADLEPLAAAERAMLVRAASLVRPGGRLVYATCSSEPEENADVIASAVRTLGVNGGLTLAPVQPGGDIPADAVDDQGHFVTTPFTHGLDAFFAAVLVRGQGRQG
jgi:16S rRNA (cytosine967-C5)-methyltransferase